MNSIQEFAALWPIWSCLMGALSGYLFLRFRVSQLEKDHKQKALADEVDFKGLSIKMNKLNEVVNANHLSTTRILSRIEGSLAPHRIVEKQSD